MPYFKRHVRILNSPTHNPKHLTENENAHVAELVDAADSKSAIRKGVKVRFLSWAQGKLKPPLNKEFEGVFTF